MSKYYVQESSGDYSSSQFVSIFMMETSGTLAWDRSRRVKLSLKMLIVWWDHTCHAHLLLHGFHFFLYLSSTCSSAKHLKLEHLRQIISPESFQTTGLTCVYNTYFCLDNPPKILYFNVSHLAQLQNCVGKHNSIINLPPFGVIFVLRT